MKIAYGSDLHLEFHDLEFTNQEADILVLAGDIMIAQFLHDHTPESIQKTLDQNNELGERQLEAVKYRAFLKRVSDRFPHTIMIAGNHEFYHGRWYQSIETLKEEVGQFDNIYFLEDQIKTINDVLFIGSTLWTDMNKNDWHTKYQVKTGMSDFRLIKNDKEKYRSITPDDVILRHAKSLEFIKTTAANATKPIVVVTHHLPSDLSIDNQYKDQYLMNGAYRSNLENFILENTIKLWICGHTHHKHSYMLGETKVVCNPRGYFGHDPQAENYDFEYLELFV
jgi:Icc-related predicted phosphoesterase